MQETYLHYLWEQKRLPFHELKLTDQRALSVHRTGLLNTGSGPDFFDGRIAIDQVNLAGNIELHIRSSDWYRHGHQHDPGYQNTILHVVYEHDQEVYIKGQAIPCLEIKKYIDPVHHKHFRRLDPTGIHIPCERFINSVQPVHIMDQIEKMAIKRLERKAHFLNSQYELCHGDHLHILYQSYASSFGQRINELPFLELSNKIPLTRAWRLQLDEAKSLYLGVAGFFQTDRYPELKPYESTWKHLRHKYQLDEMELSSWKYKGLRPVSAAHQRVLQFAEFCTIPHFFERETLFSETLFLHFYNQLKSRYLSQHLIINTIAPYLWWLGKNTGKPQLNEQALKLLQQSAPEQNHIIRFWQQFDFEIKTSFETQGFLELKNEFCQKKKCLSCKIGNQILRP
ncbi:MAG: DUF2851 family protein [Bacteroidetes bacterium]|nr:MAG: DUF2851 family protein [Bacteroidota bacterium]